MSIIEDAKEIRESLNIEELRENGISRPPEKFRMRVTYPPFSLIETTASKEEIYGYSKLRGAVYIHYPFCPNECNTCQYDIYKYMGGYLELLKENIRMLNVEPTSIHFGGGTPTFARTHSLDCFLDFIFSFLNTGEGIENTIETRPSTFTEEKARVLKKYPISRLSIGAQDFNNPVLRAMDRNETEQSTRDAIKRARDHGFTNINIDLMFGLPDQTLQHWERNLEIVTTMAIPSVTTYHLYIRPDRPVYGMYLEQPERFPREDNNLLMNIMSVEKLTEEGYTQDPVCWFTKGAEYKYQHQADKWKRNSNLIGFGADAYWYINGYVGKNLPLDQYCKAIREGRMPILKAQKLSLEEEIARKIGFALKTQTEVSVQEYLDLDIPYVENVLIPGLKKANNLGLISRQNGHFKLTYLGRLFEEEMFALFFTDSVKRQLGEKGLSIYER